MTQQTPPLALGAGPNDDAEKHARALSLSADRQAEANDVARDATALIDRSPESFLWFPYPELHALTGPIPEEELWIWGGMSGHGKTTAAFSVFDRWVTSGTPGMYVGLETTRKVLYIQWACRRLGARGIQLHPGHVLRGRLALDSREPLPDAAMLRDALRAEIEILRRDYAESGRLVPVEWLAAHNIPKIAQQAAVWGMQFVFYDHMDHIEVDENNPSEMRAQKAILRAFHEAKNKYGVTIIALAQLNTSVLQKPGGTVRVHQPPTIEMVTFGMEKRKIADGMIASYKPLPPMPVEFELQRGYRAALRMMRDDPSLVKRFLIPETMGIVLMKDRAFGHEGDTCYLGVQHSRLTDANRLTIEDAQRRMAEFGAQSLAEHRTPAEPMDFPAMPQQAPPPPRRGRTGSKVLQGPSWWDR